MLCSEKGPDVGSSFIFGKVSCSMSWYEETTIYVIITTPKVYNRDIVALHVGKYKARFIVLPRLSLDTYKDYQTRTQWVELFYKGS